MGWPPFSSPGAVARTGLCCLNWTDRVLPNPDNSCASDTLPGDTLALGEQIAIFDVSVMDIS